MSLNSGYKGYYSDLSGLRTRAGRHLEPASSTVRFDHFVKAVTIEAGIYDRESLIKDLKIRNRGI